MKEQALKIVSDLIDNYKINGKDAVTLIIAISDNSNPQYAPAVVKDTLRNSDLNSNLKSDLENIDLCRQEIIYGNE